MTPPPFFCFFRPVAAREMLASRGHRGGRVVLQQREVCEVTHEHPSARNNCTVHIGDTGAHGSLTA